MLQDENVVTYMKQSSSVSCIEGKFPIPDDLKEMEKYFNNNRKENKMKTYKTCD